MELNPAEERKQRILAERAANLSRRLAEEEGEHDRFEVVRCTAGSETFAFPIEHLREIVPLPVLTRVPSCPDFVLGIAHIRGSLLTVLHLARFCRASGESQPQHVAVVQGTEGPLGLAIDRVLACSMVSTASLTSADDQNGRRASLGVTPDLTVVLDVPHLLAHPEIVVA